MKERQRKRMMEEFYKELDSDEKLLPEIKEINVRYCETSGTYKVNNKWRTFESHQEIFEETVRHSLKRKIENDVSININQIDPEKKIKELTIIAKKGKVIEERKVKAIVDKTMNPSFAKKQSKYLEGTLQLRNLEEEMFEYLKEQLDVSEKKFCHVTDIREKKKNIDIDMTCQHEIERIARDMQKRYGGTLKLDYKLHTRDHQTQKDLYRISATVIFPDAKKGEIISYNSEPFFIKSIDKDIHALNLETGEKINIDFNDKYEKLKKYTTTISQTNPSIKVIDPETFQEEEVFFTEKLQSNKKKKKYKIDQKITVIKLKKVYCVE